MTIFAISDLHLPAREKPMDVFGAHWENHFEKISADWRARVTPEDIVLLPGDLTWAMRLEDAREDIAKISALPGRKILLRGNHDYWWSAIGRVRRSLDKDMYALQNDAVLACGVLFAGTRGWILPQSDTPDDDMKIFMRERLRLEMSLKCARALSPTAPICVMLHYPPLNQSSAGFSDILENFGVAACVYGHLHGAGLQGAFEGEKNGVTYFQASCDKLEFKLLTVKCESLQPRP